MTKYNLFKLYNTVTVITVIFSLCSYVTSLKVTVYYEALCYDSKEFIAYQLSPHWNEISPYVDLELVPYGKAIHKLQNNKYEFLCQHGPSECIANKFQSCLLAQNLGKDKEVPLVHCIMTSGNPVSLNLVEGCSRTFGYNVESLKHCMESEVADKLLAQNGEKTWSLNPNISFVPTIVFDNLFNKTETDQALNDFVEVVCHKINNVQKPPICEGKRLHQI